MKLDAYFDDINRISVYHDGIDYNKISLLKNSGVLKSVKEEIGHNKLNLYLNENIDFNARYSLLYNGVCINVKLRHVLRTKYFDDCFKVDVSTLGSFYTKESTTFRIWAPLAIEIFVVLIGKRYKMVKGFRGIFELTINGDFDEAKYFYLIRQDNDEFQVSDPYAYSSGPNATYSNVIDLAKINKNKIKPKKDIKKFTDAIIYEMSIRDMTSDISLNTKTHGLFISLLEDVKYDDYDTGIKYIRDLGITHIQIMPVFDFARIDERNPKGYNWGYDPVQYNVIEGTYVSDVCDAYKRISEFKKLVDYIHLNNMYVNIDVVFNHVFNTKGFDLAKILPYYYFRYSNDEYLANGSFCGNELRTEAYMLKEYFKLMVKRYIDIFDIDGLRFDLMTLIDIDTINEIKQEARYIKPYFMMYGEGWNMDSVLKKDKRSNYLNYQKIDGVGYFDGYFRDEMRGNTFGKEYPGFIMGDISRKEAAIKCMCNKEINPCTRINFLECHDNRTFYDSLKNFHQYETDFDDRRRLRLSLACLILASGIPFIHSGQEFARTKHNEENTYNLDDSINKIDYSRRSEYIDLVHFLKDMIKIRNTYPCLRLDNLNDINNLANVYFENEILVYDIDNLKILINPSLEDRHYYLNGKYLARYDNDHFLNEVMSDKEVLMEHLTISILEKV